MPRLFVLVCGALTVVFTERFARDIAAASLNSSRDGLAARVAGFVAAGLLATNALSIVVNSHVGWSHATTPLFTTLGLWLVWRGVEQREQAAMLAAGLCLGVACGTHPTAALVLPGVAVYVLWRRRHLLPTSVLWLAATLALLVNLPLLMYNLQTGLGSVANAHAVLSDYSHGRFGPSELSAYFRYLGRQLLMLEQLLAGPLDLRTPSLAAALDPTLLSYAAVVITGLVILARRNGGLLLPLCALPLLLGLAYLNTSKYDPVTDGRYLAPLLPLGAIAVGVTVGRLLGQNARAIQGAACLALSGFLILQPLQHLVAYYARAARETPTNERLVASSRDLIAARRSSETVLLDARLNTLTIRSRGPSEQAGAYRGLRYLLTVANVPFEIAELDSATLAARRSESPRSLVILAAGSGSLLTQVAPSQLGLRGLDGRPADLPPPSAYYGLFRLEPRALTAP